MKTQNPMRKMTILDASSSEEAGQPGPVGFTFIELLAVISIVAMLAALLVPALAASRMDSAAAKCMSNLRQVAGAWQMYNDANRGLFPYSNQSSASPGWVSGWEDYNGALGDTSWLTLTNPANAQLAPYARSAALFKCPSDMSRNYGTTGLPRIRSISMNGAIGLNGGNTNSVGGWLPSVYANFTGGSGGPYRCYFKESDLGLPSPAGLFLLVEEHPDSINDACFAVEMPTSAAATRWVDVPAKYHANACNFSFTDGHAELHPWQMPQSIPNPVYSPSMFIPPTVSNNPDVWWVANRTSARIDGQPNPFPGGN
jgi:prepilin-type N-terminal cleavage/methylation domain-containing protein/prepilin-type processing-associated H-X9-DG protein